MADEITPPTSPEPPRRLTPSPPSTFTVPKFGFAGFCLLIGLVTFAIQQGCSVTGNAPSWIWGTVWFFVAIVLVLLAIWFWDQTATHHWIRKSLLSLFVIGVMGGLSYIPVAKQYRAELMPRKPMEAAPKAPTAAEIAEEIAKKIPREHDVEKGKRDRVGITDKVSVKVHRAAQATELKPLKVSIVSPTQPGIVIDNQTDDVVDGITWELVLFRVTDQAFFSYATQNIGYIKAHSRSARYAMELSTLSQAPGGGGQIATDESFIGTLVVDCPTCKGTTLIVGFVWGKSGWFYEAPDGNGHLFVPRLPWTKDSISQFSESVNATIRPEYRNPIF